MSSDIKFSRLLGINRQQGGSMMQISMGDHVQNHVGSMHASAQFALAEIGSGDFLRQEYPNLADKAHAMVRRAEIKYSKQVKTDLFAHPYIKQEDSDKFEHNLELKGHVILPVHVKLKTEAGEIATHAVYYWYIALMSNQ